VNCPADELERSEVQAISRSFMNKIEKVLGPTRDIPAPDVNTNAQVMAWMMDEYGKLHGHTPASVTGKPIVLEGSYGREAATGRGVVNMVREAAPELDLNPAEMRVVVQGCGDVGSCGARLMAGRDDPPGQRAPAQLPHGRGGCEQPYHSGRGRDPRRPRDLGRARPDGERRRGRRLLLRVGAEPAAPPLGRARGERTPRPDHAPRLPRGVRAGPRARAPATPGRVRDR